MICASCGEDCGSIGYKCKKCSKDCCGETTSGFPSEYCDKCFAELLTWNPCPLCGAAIVVETNDYEYIQMRCQDCGLGMSFQPMEAQTIEEWCAFWNRRPEIMTSSEVTPETTAVECEIS